MTDRELLELAAKAAGLTFDARVYIKSGHLLVTDKDAGQQFFWNPLADDGDALRHFPHDVEAQMERGYWQEDNGTDPFAATRRAIVRAAAEIGREMP